MSNVQNKVAVVTGAASGIGRALALGLARRGARLALSDVHDRGLADTADRIKALGADVHIAHLDVSDRAAVEAYAAAVADHYGTVHQIYNNAGVPGGSRTVLDADWESYEHVIGINLFGVIHGTKAFLPHLIASGDGHVINVSSLNGYLAQPMLSDYCASKFAVRGFTEALRAEMLAARHPVRVTVVHPGGVRTNIANAGLEKAAGREPTAQELARVDTYNSRLLTLPAERAAQIIVDGVERGSPRILVGRDAKSVDLLVRLLPKLHPKLLLRVERRLFGDA
ncbi:SDR family NAD(P)-dependent oxidoreductase [Streptomyces sp. NPDC091217]|uniref:SDR family NAD(P)-dependent oxidoreductase n=1 Tax=Streptomyces sp. NPDC091217 TaxID=3365975 RepID=UPI00380963D3